jgi:hypothetical protein
LGAATAGRLALFAPATAGAARPQMPRLTLTQLA